MQFVEITRMKFLESLSAMHRSSLQSHIFFGVQTVSDASFSCPAFLASRWLGEVLSEDCRANFPYAAALAESCRVLQQTTARVTDRIALLVAGSRKQVCPAVVVFLTRVVSVVARDPSAARCTLKIATTALFRISAHTTLRGELSAEA